MSTNGDLEGVGGATAAVKMRTPKIYAIDVRETVG
jgi:hypothetical protein